jgi:glutaminyl-peptide cyclotransferase
MVLCSCVLAGALGLGPEATAQDDAGFVVVATYAHDPSAFTEGLAFRGSNLFEGTGLNGASDLRRVDLATGEVIRQTDLGDRYFGEGITPVAGKVFQLTYKAGKCLVYRASTFERIGRFSYEGQGWGLTFNGHRLVMSNGTDVIRFRKPRTFEVARKISVTRDGEPVSQLNELEWVDGEVFANVFPTDEVVRIDPATGEVIGRLDLAGLRAQEEAQNEGAQVTNGIAYLASEGHLFVTGKYWSHVFEIQLTSPPGS